MLQLTGTIDRIEGDKAVIILADKQQVSVDKRMLDWDAVEGDEITLAFGRAEAKGASQADLAREYLNKLLKKNGDETA